MAYSNEPESKYSEKYQKNQGTIARNSKDENFAMQESRRQRLNVTEKHTKRGIKYSLNLEPGM